VWECGGVGGLGEWENGRVGELGNGSTRWALTGILSVAYAPILPLTHSPTPPFLVTPFIFFH
jgi:hypothetical protein